MLNCVRITCYVISKVFTQLFLLHFDFLSSRFDATTCGEITGLLGLQLLCLASKLGAGIKWSVDNLPEVSITTVKACSQHVFRSFRRLTTLIIHHPAHSFITRLKPFFSANPSHRNLHFLFQDRLHGFPANCLPRYFWAYPCCLLAEWSRESNPRRLTEPKKRAWRHGRAWKMKICAWKNQDPCFNFYTHIYALLHKYPV